MFFFVCSSIYYCWIYLQIHVEGFLNLGIILRGWYCKIQIHHRDGQYYLLSNMRGGWYFFQNIVSSPSPSKWQQVKIGDRLWVNLLHVQRSKDDLWFRSRLVTCKEMKSLMSPSCSRIQKVGVWFTSGFTSSTHRHSIESHCSTSCELA